MNEQLRLAERGHRSKCHLNGPWFLQDETKDRLDASAWEEVKYDPNNAKQMEIHELPEEDRKIMMGIVTSQKEEEEEVGKMPTIPQSQEEEKYDSSVISD